LGICFDDACYDHFAALELMHDVMDMVVREAGHSYV
jgi:hypothetical protein